MYFISIMSIETIPYKIMEESAYQQDAESNKVGEKVGKPLDQLPPDDQKKDTRVYSPETTQTTLATIHAQETKERSENVPQSPDIYFESLGYIESARNQGATME
jgi:hypothetical protein